MTDEADGRPTRPATPITDPPTPEPAATDAPSIGSGSDDALPGIGPVPPTMALPAREPPEPTASPGGSAGPWAGAQEPPAAGPGPMTELGPLAFVICVGFVVGLAAGGVAGAIGGIIIAAPVGLVLFPPGRHLHALTYRGTPWTVSYALGLVALLVVCQLVFGLTAGALMAILGAQSLAVFGMAGAVGATALVTMIALSRSIDRGVDWASLGLYRGQLLENVWTGVQAGLVMVAINLLSIRVMCSLDIWQLEGITFGNMLFKVDTLGGALLALVGGALIVPICEEILFRGILFSALRRSRGPLPAVILSSVIFGLLHLPDALRPALIGVLLGTLYHVTGNLWVSITAHAVLNGATLVLSWDHGALVGSMSWTVAGLVLLLLAFLVVPPASVLEKAPLATPKACPCCGASWQASARCPECGHPGRRRLSPAVRWSVRCVAVAFLLFASFLSCLLDLALAAPYASSWPADLLGMKHEALLVMGRDREAQALARDWAADRPDDEAPQMLIVGRAYRRQDYAGALKTLEPLLRSSKDKASRGRVTNLGSLVLAELGKGHLDRAIDLGRESLSLASKESRLHVEDTLGWALVRAGRLKEARRYLDRPMTAYGTLTRASAAEIGYHRGVMLWALGQPLKAREDLTTAVNIGRRGEPFSTRAREILEKSALPQGLVAPPPKEGLSTPAGTPSPRVRGPGPGAAVPDLRASSSIPGRPTSNLCR